MSLPHNVKAHRVSYSPAYLLKESRSCMTPFTQDREQKAYEASVERVKTSLVNVQANWHASAHSGGNPREHERRAAEAAENMRVMHERLLVVRRERLRAIYAADRAEWQRQLAEQGLAIEVQHD